MDFVKKLVNNPLFQLATALLGLLGFNLLSVLNLWTSLNIFFLLLVCIIFYHIYISLRNKYSKLSKAIIENHKELISIYSRVLTKLIQKNLELRRKISKHEATSDDYLSMLKDLQYELYRDLVESLKNILEEINSVMNIKENISITIKHVFTPVEDNDNVKVCTIWRDHKSFYKGRKVGIETETPLSENGDFKKMYKSKNEETKHFISNDLNQEKDYFNSSIGWFKQYNATIVVPIEIQRIKDGMIGFLCVDSLNKSKKEVFNDHHIGILKTYSTNIGLFSLNIERISKDIIDEYNKNQLIKYKEKTREVILGKNKSYIEDK